MFVYLLITAELAILYTVFWYLYLRQPKEARRIVGNTWGSYHPAATSAGIDASFMMDSGASCAHCYVQSGQEPTGSAVKPFMVPVHDEMILDLKTNHYVPNALPQKTVLGSLIQQIDDCLSEMNVRP